MYRKIFCNATNLCNVAKNIPIEFTQNNHDCVFHTARKMGKEFFDDTKYVFPNKMQERERERDGNTHIYISVETATKQIRNNRYIGRNEAK